MPPTQTHAPNGGYIALVSLLIVAAAGLTIGLAVSLTALGQLQGSLASSIAVRAHGAATACAEEGLEHVRLSWQNYNTTLSFENSSCILEVVVAGSQATIVATGSADRYHQRVRATVDSQLEVISWDEQ